MSEPEPMMSFVSSLRLDGRDLHLIERCTTDFSDSTVAMDADGRIPAFGSRDEARAEITRRFPLPRGKPLSDASTIEEVTAAMEDQFASKLTLSYDFDVARAWVKAPGARGITPTQALAVWELCWQVGEAPRIQRFDPMGMYATVENMQRDASHRDHYELILLGMKLTGIVTMAREGQAEPEWSLDVDFSRLASILEAGVTAVIRRLDIQ